MPRFLPVDIASEYTQPGSQPGFLIRIFLPNVTLRFTTLDTDYTYAGDLYTSSDVDLPDFGFDGTVSPGAQLQFGDMDAIFWAAAMQRQFVDARCEIDQVYAHAPNQAVHVFVGRCSGPKRSVGSNGSVFSIPLEAESTNQYAPKQKVQDVIDLKWLVPAGGIIVINGQKWIIDRPNTSRT